MALRLTDGSEGFHPVGAAEPEPIRPGEYAYVDDADDVICRLEVRQVEKTKVTAATRDLFLIVQGNPATSAEAVRAGHERLVAVLTRFFGGKTVPAPPPLTAGHRGPVAKRRSSHRARRETTQLTIRKKRPVATNASS